MQSVLVEMRQFIAIQFGARRNYMVPAILEQAGLLDSLYTDLCASAGLGAILDRYSPPFLKQNALKQLLNRRVPQCLEKKVQTLDWPAIRYLVRNRLAGSDLIKKDNALTTFTQEFSQEMLAKRVGKATHIFSMFGEGIDFLEVAKVQGMRVFVEVYISPNTHRIVHKEEMCFPDFEPPIASSLLHKYDQYVSRLCNVADVFIAPSNFVVRGLSEFGVDHQKCRVVPYATEDSWLSLTNQTKQGRILFVGTAELRKGIHIFGMAAQRLYHRNYEFRVAGNVSSTVQTHQLTRQLTFLGRVPRSEIQHEFTQADIFVLPSLSEGSAEVIYQALAVGLPVITTEGAGSVVRDGIEGFIVPERDAETLANRIEELVENREMRNSMAVAAKQRALEFTWSKYAERLLPILQFD